MFKSGVKERITIVRRSAQALDLPLLNNAKDRFVVVPPPTNDEARQTKEPEKKIPGSFHILSKQCCLEYFIVECYRRRYKYLPFDNQGSIFPKLQYIRPLPG